MARRKADRPTETIFMLNRGKRADVYMVDDEEPWELVCIDQVFMDNGDTYFAGRDLETNATLVFNINFLKNIVFYPIEPELVKNNVSTMHQGIICDDCGMPILISPNHKDDFYCQNCYHYFSSK